MKTTEKKTILLFFSLLSLFLVFPIVTSGGAPGAPTLSAGDFYNCSKSGVCPCPALSWTPSTSDTANITTQILNIDHVAIDTSIAIGNDGLPVISYKNQTDGDLMITKCGNAFCSSGNTTTQINDAHEVGYISAIDVPSDGLPVIASMNYTDGDLMITKCSNASCSLSTTTQIVNADNISEGISITINADGLPIIAHKNQTDGDLMITKCGNAFCSSGNTITQITDSDDVGYFSSIATGTDGFPIISYKDSTLDDLIVTKCLNSSCSNSTTTRFSNADAIGYGSSIAIGSDGLPVISHMNNTDYNLMITKCLNSSCSLSSTTQMSDKVGFTYHTSIAIGTDGFPVIAFYNSSSTDLMITKCGNAYCSNSITTYISNPESVGDYMSIAVPSDGLPVISYKNETDGDLMITKCGTPSCSDLGNISYNLYRTNPDGSTSTYSSVLSSFRDEGSASLMFNGTTTNAYVNAGSGTGLNINTNELTIEAWVKETTRGAYAKIVSRRQVGAMSFYFLGSRGGYPYGSIGDGTNQTYISKDTTMPLNTWHHLAFTFSDQANSENLYYDGQLTKSTTTTQILGNLTGANLTIGADEQGTTNYFNGLIDEVRIYNRVLSSSEINEHYMGIFKNEKGLKVYLSFDEGTGTAAYDRSGNNNNGTLTNGPVWQTDSTTSAKVLPLQPSQNYRYTVRAFNEFGQPSGPSNEVLVNKSCAVQQKPDLTLTPQCNGSNPQIKLDWSDDSGTNYWSVYRWGPSDSGFNFITNISSPSEYVDNNVVSGGNYQYYVVAFGDSSNTMSDMLDTNAPSCSSGPTTPVLTLTDLYSCSKSGICLCPNFSWTTSTTNVANITTQLSNPDNVGLYTDIAIGRDGLPIISYKNSTDTDLMVTHCGNISCTVSTTTQIINVDDIGGGGQTSIAIGADGLPIISHWNQTDSDLMVTKCLTYSCTVSTTTQVVNAAADIGYFSSITIPPDGLPVISHKNSSVYDLLVTKCLNPYCSVSTTTQFFDSDMVGYGSSIATGTDGLPVISYINRTDGNLAITKCGNAYCSSGNITTQLPQSLGTSSSVFTSIAVPSDGLPVISYYNSITRNLMVTKCGNASCSSGNTITEIIDPDGVGYYSSIAVGTDNLPVIAYSNDWDDEVMVTKCGNASCSSGNITTQLADTDSVGDYISVAIGSDGLPIISYWNVTDGDLMITKCGNASCSNLSNNISYNLYRTNPDSSTSVYPNVLPPFRDQGYSPTSLRFNGTTSYVNAGSGASLDIAGDITIEAWVKEIARVSMSKIVSRRSVDSFYFLGSTGGLPYAGIGDGTLYTTVAKDTAMPLNEWHYLAFAFNDTSNEGLLYYDGQLTKSAIINQSIGNLSGVNLSIGADQQGTTNFFNGLLEDVKIYNRVLSSLEISEHYKGIYGNETGLKIFLNLDEATGTIAYDRSGNNNNGTLTNGPIWQADSHLPTTVLPLQQSQNYRYYVRAFDYLGQLSGPSNEVFVNGSCGAVQQKPDLTLIPQCNGSNPQIRLNWSDDPNANYWSVYRWGPSDSGFNFITSISSPSEYIDNNVVSGGNYQYYVVAFGDSSNTMSDMFDADAPSCSSNPVTPTLTLTDLYSCSGSGTCVCPNLSWTTSTVNIANITTQPSNPDYVGWYTDVAISRDGFPVIVYRNGTDTDLMVTKCGNISCTVSTTTQITSTDDIGHGGQMSVIVAPDGLPIIAHWNLTDSDLMVTKCLNYSCSTSTSYQITSPDDIGYYPSITIGSDGLPVISHKNSTVYDPLVTKCLNSTCSLSTTTQFFDPDMVGYGSSMATGTDGLPIFSYTNRTDGNMMVTKCGNNSCSSGNITTQFPYYIGTSTPYTSLAVAPDGLPVIAYQDATNTDLMISKCGNASCSSGNTTTRIISSDNIGFYVSAAVPSDNLPVIAYRNNTDSDVMVIKCGNASCTSGNTITQIADPDSVGTDLSLTIGTDGLPIITYLNSTDGDLMITKCSTPSCANISNNVTYNLYRTNPDSSTSVYPNAITPLRDEGSATSSLRFDGTSNYMDLGDKTAYDLASTSHSLEVWVKVPATTTAGSYGHIINRMTGGTPGYGYAIYVSNVTGNVIYDERAASGNYVGMNSGMNIVDNNWHHIVATVNLFPKTASFYIDGALVGSDTYAGDLIDYDRPLRVGGIPGGNYFPGLIDGLRIYTRALSSTEVTEHKSGIYNNESGLLLYLNFDEATSTIARDRSGNNNNGTLINGPVWQKDSPPRQKEVLPLAQSQNYKYYVRAFNDLGQASGPSNEVVANGSCAGPLTAPVLSLNGTVFSYAVPLAWTDAGQEDSYKLFRRQVGEAFNYGSPLVTLASSSGISYYVDYTVTEGTTSEYRVIATRGTETATSNILTVVIPPGAPDSFDLSGSFLIGNRIHLTWTQPVHSESGGPLLYTVYRDSMQALTSPIAVCSSTEPVMECYDENPTFAERYYRAEATNGGGTGISDVWKWRSPIPIWRETTAQ